MVRLISLIVGLLISKTASGSASDPEAAANWRRTILWVMGGLGVCGILTVGALGAVFILVASKAPDAGSQKLAASPEQTALQKAELAITGDSKGIAHGNSLAAEALAEKFATVMEQVDAEAFTNTDAKLKLSGGHYVTFCELHQDRCVFVVHVPEYRRFTADAREVLEDLAWQTAQLVVQDEMDPEDRLAVGLRGVLLYGAVLEGTAGAGEEEEPSFERSEDRNRLVAYFQPDVATESPAAAGDPAVVAQATPPGDELSLADDSLPTAEEFPPEETLADAPDAQFQVDMTDAELPVVEEPAESFDPVSESSAEELILAQAPAAAKPQNVTSDPASVQLAERATAVLKTSCYRCHGEEGTSEGGFNFVLNLEKLSTTHVAAKNPGGSLLYQRLTATDETVMPPPSEMPRPSVEDIATIKAWIDAGAPVPASAEQRTFITNDQVLAWIVADIRKANERSRRFLRYFTLTHLHNAGVSEDELQTYRNAFAKLVNSLSWNTDLVIPQPIDEAKTVFRLDIRDLHWNIENWAAIEERNPYFLDLPTEDAHACGEETQTKMPYVRADWFVFAASKPPLYHTMLGIPETDVELEQLLRVNVQANIDQEQAIRAAFNRSGVSQNNRLIEWHKSPYGSYWKSYDFGGNAGQQNLFAYPLGPGNAGNSFQHDGGEIIFTLPNGLQGYLLVEGHGNRIDAGPTNIVSDLRQPDRTVTNGISCMSCHFAGVIPKTDEVGAVVRANPKAFADSEDILALYRDPKELNAILGVDAQRFAAALEKLGITSLSRSGEPISATAARFQQELDLRLASAEFGLTPEEFDVRLQESAEVIGRTFGILRVPGGTLKRDVFVASFGDAVTEMGLLEVRRTASTGRRPTGSGTAARTAPPRRTPAMGAGRQGAALPTTKDGKPGEVLRIGDLNWGVQSMAFSPAGNWLALGKMDRALILHDLVKNQRLDAHEDLDLLSSVEVCRFTPDGSHLLACGRSGTILVYEVANDGRLKQAWQYAGHSDEVAALAVSDDGQFALSGDRDDVQYWKIDGGELLATFTGFKGPVKACHFLSGRVAMATDGETLLQLNLTKQSVERQLKLARSWTVQSVAFSPDGDFVAICDGSDVHRWNLKDSVEMPKLDESDMQWTCAFTPDGTRLLTGAQGKVHIWDFRKGTRLHTLPMDDTHYIQCLAISPDGKYVATIGSSAGQDVQIFQLPARRR